MKKQGIFIFIFGVILLTSCGQNYQPEKHFTQEQLNHLLLDLAPYVNKKPKHISQEERFLPQNRSYYSQRIKDQNAHFKYIYPTDSAHFFMIVQRDLTSLFRHYNCIGGYIPKQNEEANFIFYSSRLTEEEADMRGKELFEEMISKGNINKYFGNREYLKWPNKDVYYSKEKKLWTLHENSEWAKITKLAESKD